MKRILALSTPSYPVSSDILATQFHAAYLCATRECRDGPFPRTASEQQFRDLSVAAVLLGPEYKETMELSRASLTWCVIEEIKKGEWIKRRTRSRELLKGSEGTFESTPW